MQYAQSVGVGLVLLSGLMIFLIHWFRGAFRERHDSSLRFVKATCLLGALLLFMSTNSFPWDKLQALNPVFAALISSLQFPNRFLGWGITCLVTVFGYLLLYFEKQDQRFYWVMAAAAVLGMTTSGMYLLDFANRSDNYFELYNQESMGFGYISGAEYLIEGTDSELLTFSVPTAGSGVEITDYEKAGLGAALTCVNQGDTNGYIELPLLLYKGYQAVDTGSGQRLQLYAGDNQKLCVLIPAGYSGNLQVSFVSPFYWRLAEWITLCTAVLLAVKGWRWRRTLI